VPSHAWVDSVVETFGAADPLLSAGASLLVLLALLVAMRNLQVPVRAASAVAWVYLLFFALSILLRLAGTLSQKMGATSRSCAVRCSSRWRVQRRSRSWPSQSSVRRNALARAVCSRCKALTVRV
jgi:hypothetical protein